MNGDGLLDLVVLSSNYTYLVFLNNTGQPGHFQAPVHTSVEVYSGLPLIGDFNSDGVPDIGAANGPSNQFQVYPGALTVAANLANIAPPQTYQNVAASYSGDMHFEPSTSSPVAASSISAIPTSIFLSPFPKTILAGSTLAVTAIVTSSGGIPTSGSVTLVLNGPSFSDMPLGPAPVNAAGYATIPIPILEPGSYNFAVTYSANATYRPKLSIRQFLRLRQRPIGLDLRFSKRHPCDRRRHDRVDNSLVECAWHDKH